ncbi:MAG: tRNA (adenosine(37)-N6)-dimethylallyltransferase MiaA [Anaerolineae bacterium]|nr:tRNA (adenosine(37)-N6)-dimethylallyltransferase MiaA [Anaerolineae bacterium]MDW8070392.1 tRNA (adenosine(37)-N6)-dimethylallyltransferase MiaA [Anaerolineae bacterium]
MKSPLIVIVGPTAVGKTALAVRLCQRYDGEIVSADSRQIYRGMDIGTAKPTLAEQAAARHHLIDIIEPDQTLGVAEYQSLAYAAIEDILRRERLPFLVGGSGQYVHAVVKGWKVPRVPPDYALRAELETEARRIGAYALHARLTELDPQAAARIDYRNVRRVIRALEVCLKTGRPISAQQGAQPPPYRILQIGLTMPREQLYMRVDARIERMMAEGLLDEVRRLMARGYTLNLPAMSGLGYRQLGEYLIGHISLEEAVHRMKKETRRFVRQQYNWFRLNDPAIHWIDVSNTDALETASQLIVHFLRSGF